jgi:hypothetical protein
VDDAGHKVQGGGVVASGGCRAAYLRVASGGGGGDAGPHVVFGVARVGGGVLDLESGDCVGQVGGVRRAGCGGGGWGFAGFASTAKEITSALLFDSGVRSL